MTFNILAIDPGSNMLGASIFTLDAKTLDIVDIKTVSINLKFAPHVQDTTANKVYRINRLVKYIKSMLDYSDAKIVTIESGYINMNRPGAVIPLAQSVAIIENTIINHSPFIKIFTVTPSLVKMNVNASFKAKKEEVQRCVANIKEISRLVNPYKRTEHEVDSIAINYSMLNNLRNDGNFLLLTL